MNTSSFDFKRCGRALLVWVLLITLIFTGGCVAIPAGQERVSTYELSRKKVIDKQVQKTVLSPKNESYSGDLSVHFNSVYKHSSYDLVSKEVNGYQKKVIIGLYPGIGSNWYVGENIHNSYSDDIGVAIIAPIVNCTLLLPTLVPWFSEFGRGWEPAKTLGKGGLSKTTPLFSLIGWAKTGKQFEEEKETKENFNDKNIKEAISNKSITASINSGLLNIDQKTDYSGECVFKPDEWPILNESDVEVVLRSKDTQPAPNKVEITIPHEIVGSNLHKKIMDADFPFDTIYIDGKPIDFTKGTPKLAPRPLIKAEIVEQLSGDPSVSRVKLTAKNKGRGTLYRFFGKTRSDIDLLNNHLIIFGKIKPGEIITRELQLPIRTISEKDRAAVDIEFFETNNNQPMALSLNIDGQTLSRPVLAYTYTIIDDPARSNQAVGNGDGIIQIGESVDLVVTVKNTGKAAARNAVLEIQMPDNPSLTTYGDTRILLGDFPPETTVSKILNVQVKPTSTMSQIPVQVSIAEDSFLFSLNEKTILPFNAKIQPAIIAINEIRYVVEQTAVMRKGVASSSPEYGRAPKGTRLKAIGEIGDWMQVEVPQKNSNEKERVWIARQATSHQPPDGKMQTVPIVVTQFKMPPVITFVEPAGDIRVTEDSIRVVASVTSSSSSLNNVSLYIASPPYKNFVKRGIKIRPKEDLTGQEFSKGERILRDLIQFPLGKTDIKIVAENDLGEISERSISITRTEKIGETFLLSVGVNKYPGAKALNCAVSDAQMFYNYAMNNFNIDDNRSWLLTDQSATRDAIMGRMAEITGNVKKEDSVIIFLAGHGHIERLGMMEEKYFVPYLEQWGGFVSRGIAMSDFKRLLSSMAAEKIFVIADACYSGEMIAMRGGKLFSGLGGKGRIVLGYEGPAREDAQLGHGYLTYYFVDGIRTGKADQNKDNRISIREAYEYADEKIKKITGEGLWIKGEGDLIWNR